MSILHLTIETFQRCLQKYITFIHEISFVLVPFKISCGIYSRLLRSFQIKVWKICDFCSKFSKSLQCSWFWISIKWGSSKFHLWWLRFHAKCAAGTREAGTIADCFKQSGKIMRKVLLRYSPRIFHLLQHAIPRVFLSFEHLLPWPALGGFCSFFCSYSISAVGFSFSTLLLNITLLLITLVSPLTESSV